MRRFGTVGACDGPACCGSPTGVSRARRNRQGPRRGPPRRRAAHQSVHHASPVWRQAEPRRRGAPRTSPAARRARGATRLGRGLMISAARPRAKRGFSSVSPSGRHRSARPFHEHSLAVRQVPHGCRPEAHALDGHHSPGAPGGARAEAGAVATSGPPRLELAVSTERSARRYRSVTSRSLGAPGSVLVPSEGYFTDLPSVAAHCPIIAAPCRGLPNSCPRSSG